jgi:electron transfer flavoprotein alpha subunit
MASGILVFCEHDNGAPKKTAFELLGKAVSLSADVGGAVTAVMVGADSSGGLGEYGAATVYTVAGDDFTTYTTGAWTDAVAAVIAKVDPALVLAPASSSTRDFFPRLSARLGAGMITEATSLSAEGGELVAFRPVYGGKAFSGVKVSSALALVTVRPNSFGQPSATGGAANHEAMSVVVNGNYASHVDTVASTSTVVDLTEADRIVSGGRSLKSKEAYDDVIGTLAAAMGATPGASRAAVDAGYASHTSQVGQTGKVVNPSLYIACGISGAIQHLAGMRTSKVIVAINKDPDAPIFQHATYGIVGDLFDVCPALEKVIRERL